MDRPGESGDKAEPGYGDYLRQHSAWTRRAADLQTEAADLSGRLAEHGAPGAADMRDEAVRLRQVMGHIADVTAAQSIAHDELMAAGGPDNSRAYVEYEATTRRHNELLPKEHRPE